MDRFVSFKLIGLALHRDVDCMYYLFSRCPRMYLFRAAVFIVVTLVVVLVSDWRHVYNNTWSRICAALQFNMTPKFSKSVLILLLKMTIFDMVQWLTARNMRAYPIWAFVFHVWFALKFGFIRSFDYFGWCLKMHISDRKPSFRFWLCRLYFWRWSCNIWTEDIFMSIFGR